MIRLETFDVCEPEQSLSCRTVFEWTGNEAAAQAATWVVGKPTAVLSVIIIGFLLRWLLHRLVDRIVRRAESGLGPHKSTMSLGAAQSHASAIIKQRRQQRARTIGSLAKSVVTAVVLTMVTIMALSELGLDVAPLIASAGIIGIALGFGAQSLVSDFLAGIFMLMEDQYGVGDEVDLGEVFGTVEAVSLRVTRVRDLHGTVWYVRNGEIVRVGNASQNWSRTVLDIGVGYGENLTLVQRVLSEVASDLWHDEEFDGRILEEPSVWGVQDLAADGVLVRIALKTAPGQQWGIARELRMRIKNRFDHEGIEIPFPQRVVWHRGEAPQDLADATSGGGDDRVGDDRTG